MTALLGAALLSVLVAGCRDVPDAPGDALATEAQGGSGRALRGTDWRIRGLRKVIEDGAGLRARISAGKAELHGMPLLSFRFSPIKQLELQDLRVTIEGGDGLAGTPVAIVDAFGPVSPDDPVASVVVHGIEIDHPASDPADACSISAANARWSPGSSSGGVTLVLHGNVRMRIGGTEQVVDATHLKFRRNGIELHDTVQRRGPGVQSPDGGPTPFCKVVS